MAKSDEIDKVCENCGNLIPCGEGDYVCFEMIETVPIMDYTPTGDYLKCEGKLFNAA